MIDVGAEENRLLARVSSAAERVVLRHFPGARWLPGRGAFSLPRQMGTYRLLTELLGPDGWRYPASLAEEVRLAAEAQTGTPTGKAELQDLGDELAVRCGFPDRELVKRVPGYRWVPQERRWSLPRVPAAVRILEEAFGPALTIIDEERFRSWREEAEASMKSELSEAQQEDEEAAPEAEQTFEEAAARAVPLPIRGRRAQPPPGVEVGATTAALPAAPGAGTAADELVERLDRLSAALERLVAILERRAGAAGAGGAIVLAPPTPDSSDDEEETATDGIGWREWLERIRKEPDEATRRALEGRLGTADGAETATVWCLLGFWHLAQRHWHDALQSFRRGIGLGASLEADFEAEVERGYRLGAARLFPGALAEEAERPGAAIGVFAQELRQAAAFTTPEELEALRTAGDDLAADVYLARRYGDLHALARFAQFFAAARRRARVDEQRLSEFIRDGAISEKIHVLALVLLANVLLESDDVSGWEMQWPRDTTSGGDFSWVAGRALEVLRQASADLPGVVPVGALASLAIIARGPREWATRDQRRQLLRFVEAGSPLRKYAEFLAGFRLAAEGDKAILEREFSGYFEQLKQRSLDESWEHLTEVLVNGTAKLQSKVIDEVLPAALEERGLGGSPEVLLEAAEFAKGTTHGDNTLNRIADGVEDETIPGAAALDGEQRLRLFRCALEAAKQKSHDQDADRAFLRIVRELLRQGRADEVPNLCEECMTAFPALRERAQLAGLEWALEQEQPFEAMLQNLLSQFKPESPRLQDLEVLIDAFPELREAGGERLNRLLAGRQKRSASPEQLRGKSVLIVGGHPSLQEKAKPKLEALGLEVEWLDSGEAKQGGRAVDRARGAVDLVVVNAAYIGHAASHRVVEAARMAANQFVLRAFPGPRMLVAVVSEALAPGDGREVRKGSGASRSR